MTFDEGYTIDKHKVGISAIRGRTGIGLHTKTSCSRFSIGHIQLLGSRDKDAFCDFLIEEVIDNTQPSGWDLILETLWTVDGTREGRVDNIEWCLPHISELG